MTIKVHIPPDLETELRKHAAAAGKDLQTFALDALHEKIANSNGFREDPPDLSTEQQVAEWLSWTSSHPRLGYPVDDSRESIYAGRGE